MKTELRRVLIDGRTDGFPFVHIGAKAGHDVSKTLRHSRN